MRLKSYDIPLVSLPINSFRLRLSSRRIVFINGCRSSFAKVFLLISEILPLFLLCRVYDFQVELFLKFLFLGQVLFPFPRSQALARFNICIFLLIYWIFHISPSGLLLDLPGSVVLFLLSNPKHEPQIPASESMNFLTKYPVCMVLQWGRCCI